MIKGESPSIVLYLSLRPPYTASIAAKTYLVGYMVPNFQSSMDEKAIL